jgi:hypothetical protein
VPQITPSSQSPSPEFRAHSSIDWRLTACIITFLFAALLLFARLGHYALWDDEANTALFAQGICATGDTTAVIGHNLVAYEGGWELKNLRERYIPPLPAYLTAAFIWLLGPTAFAARIAFAMCGLAFFAVVLVWLCRDRADPWTWGLVLFSLLSNVSLILYFRQARYYGIAILLTTLLAYLYLHWSRRWQRLALMVALAIVLLASNYISFGAVMLCIALDWLIWGRRTVRTSVKNTIAAGATLLLAGAVILYIYDPFNINQPAPPQLEHHPLLQLWWNVRDLSINEFCIVPLLALVPIVGFWRRDVWLLRGGLALVIYFAAINIVEPHHSSFAELRFLSPVIPLCCVLEVRAMLGAVGQRKWLAILVGMPIFGTNVLSGSTIFHPGLIEIPLRSTICCYLGELADPPIDPYRAASDWINANLPASATVCVFPRYASYPLMFHASRQIYGWQLDYPPEPQFERQPPIQFIGREAPRFIILFGREGISQFHPIQLLDGTKVDYSVVKILPVFGKDLFRPELYMRVFKPMPVDPGRDGVFILERR